MTANKHESGKRKAIGYWICTILLCLGMFTGGMAQILRFQFNIDGARHLGYPLYILSIIGSWKVLAVIALLVPRFQLLKEWAYAGLFFAMTGAVISHLAFGDQLYQWIAPFLFAVLTVLSWYLRPANRKITDQMFN